MALSVAKAHALLIYDYTGIFRWRVAPCRRVKAGDVTGTINTKGYRVIRITGTINLAHRLAFLYQTAGWLCAQIDHENRVRDDNRWINLREATNAQNCANQGRSRRNTTGCKGVCFDKRARKFRAGIRVAGKHRHLGLFDTALKLTRHTSPPLSAISVSSQAPAAVFDWRPKS